MAKLNLTSKEKLALREFKEKVLQKLKTEVLDIKLFGSKARGGFKRTSDIDILILLKNRTVKNVKSIYHLAMEILLEYGVDLSVKIITEKEFKQRLNLQIPFYLNLEKESIPL